MPICNAMRPTGPTTIIPRNKKAGFSKYSPENPAFTSPIELVKLRFKRKRWPHILNCAAA